MILITDKIKERFIRKCNQDPFTDPGDSCIEWIGSKARKSYGVMWNNKKLVLAHRLSWAIYNNQQIPKGLVIRHTCDNPSCINPNHLLLGTQSDNMKDRMERKRNTNNCDLSDDNIKDLRMLWNESDYTAEVLADNYNISVSYLYAIVNYKRRADAGNWNR